MAIKRRKARRAAVAIDLVPTPDVKGVIITDGKLARGGRLEVGRRKVDLPDTVLEAEGLEGASTGPVKVALSADKKTIVAIGRRRWIVCYIPAPEILRRIEPRIREALLEGMVAERVISPEFAEVARSARAGER